MKYAWVLVVASVLGTVARGEEKALILPGESFQVGGKMAFILWPETRSTPQAWVLYAPTLPGLPDVHEKWMHEQFLAAGVAVAGVDVGESYGSPKGNEGLSALYRELTESRGFAPRPCLLGRSRGGLIVSSWAIANPDKVAGIAGIYPVLDVRSYPGLEKAAPSYGMTTEELQTKLGDLNPIQRAGILASKRVPVFLIHGDEDTVVPLKDNSAALVSRYQADGAKDAITLQIAPGQGHNYWEGFFRCRPLIDFVISRAKSGAAK